MNGPTTREDFEARLADLVRSAAANNVRVEGDFDDEGIDEIEDFIQQYGGIDPTQSELDEALYGLPPRAILNERIRVNGQSLIENSFLVFFNRRLITTETI